MSFEAFSDGGGWFVSDGSVRFGPYASPAVAKASAERQNDLRAVSAPDLRARLDRTGRTQATRASAREASSR